MTREEKQKAIDALKMSAPIMALTQEEFNDYIQTLNKIMDWLEQEPTTKNDLGVDCISRKAAEDITWQDPSYTDPLNILTEVRDKIRELPSVTPQQRTGYCKNCKYFEYDSVAKVDGIPLIVAHEICKKWGDGCKTKEDGYCFLFEPQESEDKR